MKIILDVFRTSSTIIVALASGAKEVIPLDSMPNLDKINRENCLLAGEYKQRKIKGFDFDNSPSEVLNADLRGKTLMLLTTNGTKAILTEKQCYIGGFLNIGEVKRLDAMPYPVGRMGEPAIEDDLCASSIFLERYGIKPDYEKIKEMIAESGRKIPQEDFEICLEIDKYKVLPFFDGEKIIDLNKAR